MTLHIQEPDEEEVVQSQTSKAIGIDLGTTHSLVSVMREGQAQLLSMESSGNYLMPSVVGWNGKKLVAGAKALALPESRYVRSIKRLMGQNLQDVDEKNIAYPLTQDDAKGLCVQLDAHVFTPQELSAAILSALKEKAQTYLGHQVTEAVITVPAYFDERARVATRDAAKLAGLKVLRLLSEPTAAALAYGFDEGTEGVWGVYDLGGGTFDFSLLDIQKGVFNVRATGGHTALGGDDMETLLARTLCGDCWEALSFDAKQKLILEAKHVKEKLSKTKSAEMTRPNGKKQDVRRTDFEQLVAPIVAETLTCVQTVLQDASLRTEDLDGVLLVGGATRTPCVVAAVKKFFGRAPLASKNPDHVVALGAGIQAHALTEHASHLLLDVTPLSLGLEIMGGQCEKLIHRNTRIPVRASQTFTTAKTNQSKLKIHVLQGEHDKAKKCRSLAHFEIEGIPPMEAGKARIRVDFLLDRDGLLTIEATEEVTNAKQSVYIRPAYGLTVDVAKELISF